MGLTFVIGGTIPGTYAFCLSCSIFSSFKLYRRMQSAWLYLRQWLPQCANCDCLESSTVTSGLCTIGCFCSYYSSSIVDHDCQFLVDTDSGKGCVLVVCRSLTRFVYKELTEDSFSTIESSHNHIVAPLRNITNLGFPILDA